MERKFVVVGDPPASGGRVLPYGGPLFEIHGHRVALIGGRAWCEGCHSVGIIAKAGGLRRLRFISEAALEGDVVICHCPVPQPLLSVLQSTGMLEDGAAHAKEAVAGMPVLAVAMATAVAAPQASPIETAAYKKTVDDSVTHPQEAEQTENICPNMTNKAFATLAMTLRDMAVDYIAGRRLPELERWDAVAQARVKTWFGIADQRTREHLQKGLAACVVVLKGLEPRNFVRFTAGGKLATCVMGGALGADAAVCKPDTTAHTIAIGMQFCHYRKNEVNFNTGEVFDATSQLLVLIHEVTHFEDTFSSNDRWYGVGLSRKNVSRENHDTLLKNADSLAAYVLGIA